MSDLTFYPHVPLVIILLVFIISMLFAYIGFRVGAKGYILRTLTLLILIFSLLNPKIISENKVDIPDTVALIVDLSPSQEINDKHLLAQQTAKIIEDELKKNKNLEIRIKKIDGRSGTRVFQALSSLLGDIPRNRIAGAIIITDGQIHDVPKDMTTYNFKAPMHFLITGNKEEKDRRLVIEDAPRFGIVGEEVAIAIKVEDEYSSSPNALVSVNINGDTTRTKSVAIGEKIILTLPLDKPGITNLVPAADWV